MTPAALVRVQALLEQLDKLKALHRAGETPSFGQVEALFDQTAAVRADIAAMPAAWPTGPGTASSFVVPPGSLLDQASQHITTALALVAAHGYGTRAKGEIR